MLFVYNILQISLGLVLLPVLLAVVLLTPKYRSATWLRFGFGLKKKVRHMGKGRPRIWVHALSVGEVSSSVSLVRKLKEKYPDGVLVFSASTSSGRKYAFSTLAKDADLLIPFPLDFYWSVKRFVQLVEPDLFVLVETDLWPNFLSVLKGNEVPALLVNGRISAESFLKYRSFNFFWKPLFKTFRFISMQTEADSEKMRRLGISSERLLNLGNLKYGVLKGEGNSNGSKSRQTETGLEASGKRLWVAGSTHRGEEEIILEVYRKLRGHFNDLYLIIAPRNIDRGPEIVALAKRMGLEAARRTRGDGCERDLLILDTLGELVGVYQSAELAFVGGSLVRQRGHNPLEPAMFGKPVIFGSHMEDFAEITEDLLKVGGAIKISDAQSLESIVAELVSDEKKRRAVGGAAARFVAQQQGVTDRHVELIDRMIREGEGGGR